MMYNVQCTFIISKTLILFEWIQEIKYGSEHDRSVDMQITGT